MFIYVYIDYKIYKVNMRSELSEIYANIIVDVCFMFYAVVCDTEFVLWPSYLSLNLTASISSLR